MKILFLFLGRMIDDKPSWVRKEIKESNFKESLNHDKIKKLTLFEKKRGNIKVI